MGDRTHVSLTIHPNDIKEPAWLEWLENEGEGEEGDNPWEWYDSECNYACCDSLEMLAKACVIFFGCHGSGGDYPSGVFFSAGHGQIHYGPEEVWDRGRIVVDVNVVGDGVKESNMFKELSIYRAYHATIKEISRAEAAHLTNRPS